MKFSSYYLISHALLLSCLNIGMTACGPHSSMITDTTLSRSESTAYLLQLKPIQSHTSHATQQSSSAYRLESCLADDQGAAIAASCVSALRTSDHQDFIFNQEHISSLQLTDQELAILNHQSAAYAQYEQALLTQHFKQGISGAATAGTIILGGTQTRKIRQQIATTKDLMAQSQQKIATSRNHVTNDIKTLDQTKLELTRITQLPDLLKDQRKILQPNFLQRTFGSNFLKDIDHQANHIESLFLEINIYSERPLSHSLHNLNSFITYDDLATMRVSPISSKLTKTLKSVFTPMFINYIQNQNLAASTPGYPTNHNFTSTLAERLVSHPKRISDQEWSHILSWFDSGHSIQETIQPNFLQKYKNYQFLQYQLTNKSFIRSKQQMLTHLSEFWRTRGVPPQLKAQWLWIQNYRRYVVPHRKFINQLHAGALPYDIAKISQKSYDHRLLHQHESRLLAERISSSQNRVHITQSHHQRLLEDIAINTKSIHDTKLQLATLSSKLKRLPKLVHFVIIGTAVATTTLIKLTVDTFNHQPTPASLNDNNDHRSYINLQLPASQPTIMNTLLTIASLQNSQVESHYIEQLCLPTPNNQGEAEVVCQSPSELAF